MATIRAQFGGLNTDLFPTRLPSGTADVCTNVDLQNGELAKRAGFSMFEDDVKGDATGVLNLYVAQFGDGDVYVVAKVANGTQNTQLYYRKVTATAASAFSAISSGATHNSADPGWFFTWRDRMHYFDRGGGSRWNPDVNSGTAYKAGIGRPTVGLLATAAADGEKDGQYRYVFTRQNSVTGEESQATEPNAAAIECRIATDTGGIAITDGTGAGKWDTEKAAGSEYEWDTAALYCSTGNTEIITMGAVSEECFPHRYYIDSTLAKTTAGSPGMNKADHVHTTDGMLTNAGGEPPAAAIGCVLPTQQAVYGNIYVSATLVAGKLMYSLSGFPTMVPQRVTYTQGGDSQSFMPRPWEGVCNAAIEGPMTCMAATGPRAFLFTPTATYMFIRASDGRPFPVPVHAGKGTASALGAVGTPHGVFALGYRSLLRLREGGARDIAEGQWQTLLEDIPAAYTNVVAAGYYSYRNEVWFAVVKSGGTVAKRILVLSIDDGRLSVYEPAGLATAEGITCLRELAYTGAEPTMLLGTNTGRILQYPSTTARDEKLDGTYGDYACQWRGYVGQEGSIRERRLLRMLVRSESNVTGRIRIGFRTMRTSDETVTQREYTLTKDKALERIAVDPVVVQGHFWQIDITSGAANTGQWKLREALFEIE